VAVNAEVTEAVKEEAWRWKCIGKRGVGSGRGICKSIKANCQNGVLRAVHIAISVPTRSFKLSSTWGVECPLQTQDLHGGNFLLGSQVAGAESPCCRGLLAHDEYARSKESSLKRDRKCKGETLVM